MEQTLKLEDYDKAVITEAGQIVEANNIETKLIGYMLGVNAQALEIDVNEHLKPKTYVVIDAKGITSVVHYNKLIVDHYNNLNEQVIRKAYVDGLTESDVTQYLIDNIIGKFDAIIFKSTSRVNISLNRNGKKFFFIYPHKQMREICLKQVIDDGIRTEQYRNYTLGFEKGIEIVDNEINLFMVKIKFFSYASLSLKLQHELKI